MNATSRYWLACAIGAAIAVAAGAFIVGVDYSRRQIRALAEEMAAQPTNTFSRCLTEMWEQSGELDADWKGKRRWHLTEVPAELPASGGGKS